MSLMERVIGIISTAYEIDRMFPHLPARIAVKKYRQQKSEELKRHLQESTGNVIPVSIPARFFEAAERLYNQENPHE